MKKEHFIKVWDLAIRTFHWSLVLGFTAAYLTGDWEGDLHAQLGYVVLGLITFRVIYGFIGTEHARFRSFLLKPSYMFMYLDNMILGRAKRFIGHNPVGGWMVIALLLSLFATSYTGLKLYAVEDDMGPLASDGFLSAPLIPDANAAVLEPVEESSGSFWGKIHEDVSHLTIFLIFVHIVGVVLVSRLQHENLVRSMLTGYKRAEDRETEDKE